MTMSSAEARCATIAIPESGIRSAPSERRVTRGILFLLAGLVAFGALATNIILPAFPQIGAELASSSAELGLLLSSFFVAFALGSLWSDRSPIALAANRWFWEALQ